MRSRLPAVLALASLVLSIVALIYLAVIYAYDIGLLRPTP